LGAGKTTLQNAALRNPAMGRTAIVVNEFGDVVVDQMLIEASSDDMMELTGGCVCCAVRGAFADGLTDLLMARRGDFDLVIVETSGLAEPGPLLAALHAHPFLSTAVRPSGVLCLVDATRGVSGLRATVEAEAQLCLADYVVLTKTDLQSADDVLLGAVSEAAPTAQLFDVSQDGFEVAELLATTIPTKPFNASSVPHGGDAGQAAFAISLTSGRALAHYRVDQFLDQLTKLLGPSLLRVKGLVELEDDVARPLLVQGVGSVFAPPERLSQWPAGADGSCLVVIARGQDRSEIQRLWDSFTHGVAADLPDADALTSNPLAVPGVRF
ncbi:MAG: GTP-binding protein, partial [Pseudomonadota bacterium]